MRNKSYEEFIAQQENGAATEPREFFKLQECPTPGCSSRNLRPTYVNGKITGFTCHCGCRYKATRNKISREIDSYELQTYNHYMIGTDVSGHSVSPDGNPIMKWY